MEFTLAKWNLLFQFTVFLIFFMTGCISQIQGTAALFLPLRLTCAQALPRRNNWIMRVSLNTKELISGFGSS